MKHLIFRGRLAFVSRNTQVRFSTTPQNASARTSPAELDLKESTTNDNPEDFSPVQLPYDRVRDQEKFGTLVRNEHFQQKSSLSNGSHVKEISLSAEKTSYAATPSPFRNADGSFTQGENSEEARLDPQTLRARVDSSIIRLPHDLSKVISNNILSAVSPDRLRERAAQIYQALEKDQIQKAPESGLDADAHIAALFLQNYSHAYRVLSELKKRVGPSFSPNSVLDIGYGPGTGMVALNELMGANYRPKTKEVYVVGRLNKEMKKRAKVLLSRQLNEVPEVETESRDSGLKSKLESELEALRSLKLEVTPEHDKQIDTESTSGTTEHEKQTRITQEQKQKQKQEQEQDDFVGPVDWSQLSIATKLRDALPSTKQYELIIVNQALLSREYNFPRDVDINLHMILRLLKPEGHLVILERGNALGFEIVARARQVMLRPESYAGERGTIPRPYIRGSSVKPQRLRREDQIVTEAHIQHEAEVLAALEREDSENFENFENFEEFDSAEYGSSSDSTLEADIEARHGKVSSEDMKYEFEDSDDFDVVDIENSDSQNPLKSEKNANSPASDDVNYHLSVVAPCPHHARCPLQLGDPKFYKISGHQHRLQFCSFSQVVHRPKYTMELKRGKRLATGWNKDAPDGFGVDSLAKSTRKSLEGSGRPGGNNSEAGSFAYLIMHRAKNDAKSISQIKEAREHQHQDQDQEWPALPRILETPDKVKKNVRLKVCAPSGNVEFWQIPRSVGKQTYHDARKARQGDLWALGKKTAVVKSRMSDENVDKLKRMANMQRKFVQKEKRKQQQKKLVSRSVSDFDDPLAELDSYATQMEQSKKYRQKGKKANFDVDLKEYEGR